MIAGSCGLQPRSLDIFARRQARLARFERALRRIAASDFSPAF
jgi:hypothetical protein